MSSPVRPTDTEMSTETRPARNSRAGRFIETLGSGRSPSVFSDALAGSHVAGHTALRWETQRVELREAAFRVRIEAPRFDASLVRMVEVPQLLKRQDVGFPRDHTRVTEKIKVDAI